MPKVAAALVFLLAVCSVALASSDSVEVLYLETYYNSPEQQPLLYTYNVDPQTGEPKQVGAPLPVAHTSVSPLTINGKHILYLSNATDVWKYYTDGQGVPESNPSQHVKFNFPSQVFSFLVDPNGKFAYAALESYNESVDYYKLILFTIDPVTGDLTDTGKVAGSYGPSSRIAEFLFGVSGRRLYFLEIIDQPYTCGEEYYYYDVHENTGSLGAVSYLVGWESCDEPMTVTFSDALTASAQIPRPGLGTVVVNNTFTAQSITCDAAMLTYCGDQTAALYFDPASKNIFVQDWNTGLTYVSQIDFQNSQLLATPTPIPNSTFLTFSPDSRVIYSMGDGTAIQIYSFDPNTGQVTPGGFLLTVIGFPVATATLGGE